ncbi:Polygalacturonase [Apostasia shenzhenica]|uniref:Exopolygalacturonase n=1 Tax=Apostasia shenzhenica TaxID=1088818 RepID=A0A2I0B918_9ASPA|nr:Polygalacturonase [Apostasia shenzhenica]
MNQTISLLLCILLSLFSFSADAMAGYNIVDFGAKLDGRTDSSAALQAAWRKACSATMSATVVVPKGRFFVSRALLQGPCNNNNLRVVIHGTITADSGFSSASEWITFKYVQGLSVHGGTFDARGQALWACKAARRSCPSGSTAVTISGSKDVLVIGTKVMNSENFQMAVIFSQGVTMQGLTITAPANSPNTDGVHVHMSTGVTITGSAMRTGDDCISLGPGVTDAWIYNIRCGPGHGVSIGSLGGSPGEPGVENVTVSSVVFTGTQNGFRVKTWANPYGGFVKDILFQHATMIDVQNPIVIDQNYCPKNNCPNNNSGIKISGVKFSDVEGTSTTEVAVKLDCSQSNPCQGIELDNIKLRYSGENMQAEAQAFCRNVQGRSTGYMIPPSCL